MNRYLKGNGENPVSGFVDHVYTKLAARLAIVVCVVAGPIIAKHFLNEYNALRASLVAAQEKNAAAMEAITRTMFDVMRDAAINATRVAEHERRLDRQETRINRLEQGRLPPL